MNWAKVMAGVLVLWSNTAMGAMLTWNANVESDLAGYRIYECTVQPCTPSSNNDSLLATVGKVTSFNIGAPSVTRYYFITAYNLQGSESSGSNGATFTPAGSQLPAPPAMQTVDLTVVGTPAIGPWGVAATTTDLRPLSAKVYLNGALHHVENDAPWSFPTDNGMAVTLQRFGNGTHKVEFVFYLKATTTEIGRANVTVQEGPPPQTSNPPAIRTVNLTVVGSPTAGPWGVSATTTDLRSLSAKVYLNGALHHVENDAPWSFPADNGMAVTPQRFGNGTHEVEFVFYLQGTTTEIGRSSVTVKEGLASIDSPDSLEKD